jgi:hypothetical protein
MRLTNGVRVFTRSQKCRQRRRAQLQQWLLSFDENVVIVQVQVMIGADLLEIIALS